MVMSTLLDMEGRSTKGQQPRLTSRHDPKVRLPLGEATEADRCVSRRVTPRAASRSGDEDKGWFSSPPAARTGPPSSELGLGPEPGGTRWQCGGGAS